MPFSWSRFTPLCKILKTSLDNIGGFRLHHHLPVSSITPTSFPSKASTVRLAYSEFSFFVLQLSRTCPWKSLTRARSSAHSLTYWGTTPHLGGTNYWPNHNPRNHRSLIGIPLHCLLVGSHCSQEPGFGSRSYCKYSTDWFCQSIWTSLLTTSWPYRRGFCPIHSLTYS